MLASRRIRIAMGIFMLAAVWNLFWTRTTSYVSANAVVDAPLITVRAPSDGVIVAPSPDLGSAVQPDTRLLELAPRNTRAQDLPRLTGDMMTARAEVDALAREIADTSAMITILEARAKAERELEIAFLTQKLNEMSEIRRQHAIRWDRAQEALTRLQSLAKNGSVADVTLRDAMLELELTDALIAEAEARVAAVRTELEAIEAGLSSPAGTGRRDAAFDRLDDMRVHQNDLRTRHEIALGRLKGLEHRRNADTDMSDGPGNFIPRAATAGVIWRASPPRGASAGLGSNLVEVVDCQRRYVEVVLSESAFDRLESGTPALIRLKGADDTFPARIAFRRADGIGSALLGGEAEVQNVTPSAGVRVYLALPPADLGDTQVATRFCDVGRSAEVTIPRKGVSDYLQPLASWIATLSERTRQLTGDLVAGGRG